MIKDFNEYKKTINNSFFAINEKDILEAFFDNCQNAGILLHSDGTIAKANKKICNTLGYTQSEMKDRLFFDFIYIEDRERTLKAFEYSKKEGSILDFKNRYIPKHLEGIEINEDNKDELVAFVWKSSFSINDFTIGEAVVILSE